MPYGAETACAGTLGRDPAFLGRSFCIGRSKK
jgi:hypothetical protein